MVGKELFTEELELAAEMNVGEVTLALPASAGVCLFISGKGQPILLLYGANLRALVRRRMADDEQEQKSKRTRLRPITATIWYRRTFSPFETELLYYQAVALIFPDRVSEFFPALDSWFIRVHPGDEYPYFGCVNRMGMDRAVYWGPFGDKKSAGRYLEIVQDLFDLCRCPEVLTQAPAAAACSYAQMGRCGAVCDGSMSKGDYQRVVRQAIEFLNRPVQERRDEMKAQMRQWAAERRYEQAQEAKRKIAQMEKLLSPGYRWVMPLEKFYLFCFQPGPRQKVEGQRPLQPTVCPFLIGPGWVHQIEPFLLSQPQPGMEKLIDHLNLVLLQSSAAEPGDGASKAVAGASLWGWISGFLYRHSADKGLYIPAAERVDAAKLAAEVTAHFNKAQPEKAGKPKLDAYSLTDEENINGHSDG